MAEGMNLLNIALLDGDDEITHWTGNPSTEGGALKKIDMSPTGGPPFFDYDTTGKYREQRMFNVDTKILGDTPAAQKAFIAKYSQGQVFENAKISGVPEGYDWIVEEHQVKHDENGPSIMSIKLAEYRPSGGA